MSVTAHEIGHWQHNDTIKGVMNSLITINAQLFFFSFLKGNKNLLFHFGFTEATPSIFMSLYIFQMIMTPVIHLIIIKNVFLVRSMEFAADRYAVGLGYGRSLKEAVTGTLVSNSSNLNPDHWYSKFKNDHPPLLERTDAIDEEVKRLTGKEDLDEAYEAYEKDFEEKLRERHGKIMNTT